MLIHIPAEELVIVPYWRISSIRSVNVDYADNCLYAVFDGEKDEKCIFDLKKYGIKLDNRFCGYEVSVGKAGVFIKLTDNNHTIYKG
jgi:hypothetical protein